MRSTTDIPKPFDGRHFNNPHPAIEAAGATAAQKGLRVWSCPYRHPSMRASWLKGFSKAQQLTLDL